MEDHEKHTASAEFTNEEIKEKLILDFSYLKSEISLMKTDKKDFSEIKRNLNSFERDLQKFLDINVSAKTKKEYINFKNSSLDKSILRFAKYMK